MYLEMEPPLAVDCDRALAAIRLLGTYNARYLWAIRFFRTLAILELAAGAYTIRSMLPWTILCVGVAYMIYRTLPGAAADFVWDIVRQHPEARARFVLAGIIRPDMPRVAPTTPAEWERSAWGSARAPTNAPRD